MIGFCTGLAASGHIVGNSYLTGLGKSRRREAQAPDFINNECGWVEVILYLFRRYTLSAPDCASDLSHSPGVQICRDPMVKAARFDDSPKGDDALDENSPENEGCDHLGYCAPALPHRARPPARFESYRQLSNSRPSYGKSFDNLNITADRNRAADLKVRSG